MSDAYIAQNSTNKERTPKERPFPYLKSARLNNTTRFPKNITASILAFGQRLMKTVAIV